MSLNKPVDLDALESAANEIDYPDLAVALRQAVAELREARELLSCATEFLVGGTEVVKSPTLGWVLATDGKGFGTCVTLEQAIAAAREWEGKQS